jgi:uncharacterized protein YggE
MLGEFCGEAHMLHRLGVLVLCLSLAGMAVADEAEGRITVTGEGSVEAVPDLATITAGVETQAPSASEALTANSVAMTAVFGVLEAAGVAREDVQTSQISLNPVWNHRPTMPEAPPELTGYAASNLVTVRVRDIARLGAVLDAMGQAGANRIQGIGFAMSEPRELEDRARARAVEDARAKAELLARTAGVTLGPVVSIAEAGRMGPPVMMRAAAEDMAMAVPIAEGQVAIEARVDMVFAIE